MSVTVSVNGVSYTIPQTSETGWATNVTSWIQAVSSSTLQKSGGTFTLTAEVDFGGSYGLKSLYYKSRTANVASSGAVRLAVSDEIHWRDNANSADLELGVNASDQLTFNGNPIVGAAALTASRALRSSAAGLIEASSVTSTELGYVSGVTSAIQTQIDSKESVSNVNAHISNTSTHGITSDIVGRTETQTLSNKTFSDAIILSEIATPSTPSSGLMKVYPKSDNFLYSLDDTGAERKVGSGSGADTFYFEDFESGVYSAFTASGSFAIANGARASSAVLDGSKEAKFTRGAANDTISLSVAIPVGYNPAIVRISFLYETDSSYVDNDIEVQIYNGATQLGVVGYQLKAGKGKHICEFQTDAATADTTYTLKFKQATAGSWTNVYIDDLTVAAREIARGAVVTDWVSYTPTIEAITSGTPVRGSGYTENVRWRRVGDSMEIQFDYDHSNAGTAASGTYTWSLPSGYSIDTSKLTPTTGGVVTLGTLYGYNGTTEYIGYISARTSTALQGIVFTSISSAGFLGSSNLSYGGTILRIKFQALIPIQGWSSNAVISSDFGSRLIASRYVDGSTSFTASTVLDFNTKDYDKTAAVTTGASWKFTAPESGIYEIKGSFSSAATAAWSAGNTVFINLHKNGSGTASQRLGALVFHAAVTTYAALPFNGSIELAAGDYIDIRGVSSQSISMSDATDTWVAISKKQSPQTLMGSEVVSAKVTGSTTSVANGANSTITWVTESYDTHNALSTTTFTCPYAGKYRVTASIGTNAAVFTAGSYHYIVLRKNGINDGTLALYINPVSGASTGSIINVMGGSCELSCVAGDALTIHYVNASGNTRTLNGDNSDNYFEITKVG